MFPLSHTSGSDGEKSCDQAGSSHQNNSPNRIIDYKTEKLVNVAEISCGAGSAIDGGVVVTDVISVGNDRFAADNPKAAMASSWYYRHPELGSIFSSENAQESSAEDL